MTRLDHIMYAVSDLEKGVDEIERLTGVRAAPGGAHPGQGTRNALLSLGERQYLEIIAPDPAQPLSGTLGEELERHQFSGIRTWAVAVDDFFIIMPVLDRFGYQYRIVEMSRTRPDGVELAWQIMQVSGHGFGYFMPFFIDWLRSPHPAGDTPGGCLLSEFSIQLPEHAGAFGDLMEALEVDVDVREGPESIRSVIESPNGRLMLH